ncbi:MAG: hypothetical protein RJA70_3624 [Pseudomonadota bacterium]|jgi:hypothetical protein
MRSLRSAPAISPDSHGSTSEHLSVEPPDSLTKHSTGTALHKTLTRFSIEHVGAE